MNYAKLYDFILGNYSHISSLLPFGYALPPLRATIELTYACNLKCRMCYQRQERKTGKGSELTLVEIKKLVDQMPLKSLISLTGGELFTRSYTLDLINYISQKRYCNLVTNATLIDSKTAKQLVKSGLKLIGVSLDGNQEIHDNIRNVVGAFDRSIEAIKLIQKEKRKRGQKFPLIDIKTVIVPENICYLFDVFQMAKQLKANFFTVSVLKGSPIQLSPPIVDNLRNNDYSYCYPNDPSFDSYLLKKQLSKILKETSGPQIRFYPGNLDSHLLTFYQNEFRADSYYPCYFPWSAFNISPHGDVFPCLALKVGNIREQSLNQIWNGSKMRTFRVKLKKNKIFPACNGCCNLWMKNK